MALRVVFHTLGCKLNQLETESLAGAFSEAGALVLGPSGGGGGSGADLVVINTCTVTGKAEQKARHLLRQALRANPGALAIVTGCYAQLDPGTLASIHERALVVPGDSKSALLALPAWLAERWQGHGDLRDALLDWLRSLEAGGGVSDPFGFFPREFAFHSRPSLKVQDGCDNLCSYCRVRLARGKSRSLPVEEVLRRLRLLEEEGKAEAVLTGVNLFQYRDGDRRFPELLRTLLEGSSTIALRLSSWEPEGVDPEFLEVFAHPRIRPHIHLPVQSGSDAVLRRMARAYRRDKVLSACEELRKAKGDPFIAADLIAGFPGETDADFRDSLELARACGFAWIHAFPFSPRPGTAAWDLGPRVPERVAGERVAELGALARQGKEAFAARRLGGLLEAVLESGPAGGEGAGFHATSADYLKLRVRGVPEGLGGGRAVLCRAEKGAGGAAPEARSRFSGEFRRRTLDLPSLIPSNSPKDPESGEDCDLETVFLSARYPS